MDSWISGATTSSPSPNATTTEPTAPRWLWPRLRWHVRVLNCWPHQFLNWKCGDRDTGLPRQVVHGGPSVGEKWLICWPPILRDGLCLIRWGFPKHIREVRNITVVRTKRIWTACCKTPRLLQYFRAGDHFSNILPTTCMAITITWRGNHPCTTPSFPWCNRLQTVNACSRECSTPACKTTSPFSVHMSGSTFCPLPYIHLLLENCFS